MQSFVDAALLDATAKNDGKVLRKTYSASAGGGIPSNAQPVLLVAPHPWISNCAAPESWEPPSSPRSYQAASCPGHLDLRNVGTLPQPGSDAEAAGLVPLASLPTENLWPGLAADSAGDEDLVSSVGGLRLVPCFSTIQQQDL